jgi:hypothetical protein
VATRAYSSLQRERQDFAQLLKYWKTVCGGLTGLLAVIPVGGFFVEAVLPGVLGVLAPLLGITLAVLLILFLYYSNRNRAIAEIGKTGKLLFFIGLVCLVVFVCSRLVWVVNVDDDWYITGLTLTTEAENAIQQKMIANETPKTLLDRMGHNSPERIWWGRWVVTAVLAFSFAGIFAFSAGSFFLFTLQNLVQDR